MIIGTLTTGATVVDTFDINYVPAHLYFIAATQLTSIKVVVAGDGVICDLLTAGISGIGVIGRNGAVANSYLIPLSTGFIPDKVCQITTVNSAAQTPILYGHAFQRATSTKGTLKGAYIQSTQVTVLAGMPHVFKDFVQIVITSPTVNDSITIQFQDGHVETFNSVELLAWIGLKSNIVTSYVIGNEDGRINYVRYIPDTNRTFAVSKFIEVGSII